MQMLVGTSGYSYKEWKGSFYPDKITAADMLGFYAERLPAVEINNTFYRLPRVSVLESWAAQVPDGFRFVIKASKRITHMKRLNEPVEETEYLFTALEALESRLGAVLFQLPPNLKKDLARLEAFLDLLPGGRRCAFEFRHESWFDDEVYDLLRREDCALCTADTDDDDDDACDPVSTASWGYLRMRRATYSDDDLAAWADRVKARAWSQAFVFFKHETAEADPTGLAARFLAHFTG